ncbi:MAG: O-antigen ligase family protein, partial [Bacteroidota bacterium]
FLVTPPLNCRKVIFKSLIFALSAFFLICLLNAFYRQYLLYERVDHFNWYFFYRYDFLEIFKQHPTYVSMYMNLAIGFLLFERLWTKNYWPIIFFIILSSGLVLAGSRMGYALFILICSIGIVQHLRKASYGQRRLILILLSCLLPLASFLLWKVPIIKERILYTLGADYEYKYNNGEFIKNKLEVEQGRLLLWKDTWELIKERPILGYGTGSKDQVLTNKYQKEEHQLFLNRKYNTHNIYLEFLLTGGILKLTIYLLGLSLLFYMGYVKKDLILVSFFLIIFLTGITESIFRAQGIMFFAFFYCFFLYDE